jgi:peptidoglycan biosynthesis protein MviN/MurJ (putative lipid II flippase)
MIASGGAQFTGQALGILIAVLVSHLIARRLGTGPEADAFLLGRRLVTSVSEVLSQVVVVVFIPLIAARAAAGDGIRKTLGETGGAALGLGVALSAGFALSAPALVRSIAPDFDPAAAALAVEVTTILALALPASVATIAFAAYCNVKGRFGLPAAIRQAPRAAVAAALLLGGGVLAIQAAAAYTIAFVGVAGLTLAMALRVGDDGRGGVSDRRPSAAVERRGGAAILIAVAALLGLWMETAFAARQGVGAVAMLDFSQRLGALCGNTLSAALGLVAFADLSRRSAADDPRGLALPFARANLTALAMLAPLQVGVLVNAGAIVDVVLVHGDLSAETAEGLTALVRIMACAPLGALIARMLIMRVLADQSLPIIRLIAMAMGLDLFSRLASFALLTPMFGLQGIPLGLCVAPVAPIVFLTLALRRRGPLLWGAAMRTCAPTAAASAGCVGAVVAGAALGPVLAEALASEFGAAPKLDSLAQLAASGLLGALALGAAVLVIRARPAPS